MNLNKRLWIGTLLVFCLVLSLAEARALVMAPSPIPLRVAGSDVVIVGKVVGYAEKKVPANRFKGDTAEYQIALLKVQDGILGKVEKEIKVGFIPPAQPKPIDPKIRPLPFRPSAPILNLGDEALLFLMKAPEGDFYTTVNYFDQVNKTVPNFAEQLAEAKKSAQLLANPTESLKSKDIGVRFETAAMLLTRYRTPPRSSGNTKIKQEPIDAQESKLILLALADADWNRAVGRPGTFMMQPQQMFYRLELTAADGWMQPKNFRDLPDAAKKWLRDNADKYRVKRMVRE